MLTINLAAAVLVFVFTTVLTIAGVWNEISRMISSIPDVQDVHDVHVWSIGHGIPAISCHVRVNDQKISEADSIRKDIEHNLLHEGVRHSVIQMECANCHCDDLYCNVTTESTLAGHHEHA